MNDNKIFDMGKAVYDVFLKSGLTPEQFADKIGCARGNVYNIFKRKSINAEQLVLISRALNHNFLLDLAMLVEENVSLPAGTGEVNPGFSEDMVTLPEGELQTINDDAYQSVLEEYLTTEHHRPLIVIAYNSASADDILYRIAEQHYGIKGYKMMTDTVNLDIKPYKVPVFTEQNERTCGKDLDTQIGEVVAAQQKSDKHLVFIVNIPECRLMFEAPYQALEDEINRTYELWSDRAHIVCLDSTGKLTARRRLKRYNGFTANHVIAWDFFKGLTEATFRDADGVPFDCGEVMQSADRLTEVYNYLAESKQIIKVDFDFKRMSVKKEMRPYKNGKEFTLWIINYPDFLDPSQDVIKGIIMYCGTIKKGDKDRKIYKNYRLIARSKGDYVMSWDRTILALTEEYAPHWPEVPSDEEFVKEVFRDYRKLQSTFITIRVLDDKKKK
jgi:hypothetical protein